MIKITTTTKTIDVDFDLPINYIEYFSICWVIFGSFDTVFKTAFWMSLD